MGNLNSDALVFFGATGDLAYKKIGSVSARKWPSPWA
jgi:glucose-6-phosphate 1-dehydrogenase